MRLWYKLHLGFGCGRLEDPYLQVACQYNIPYVESSEVLVRMISRSARELFE